MKKKLMKLSRIQNKLNNNFKNINNHKFYKKNINKNKIKFKVYKNNKKFI